MPGLVNSAAPGGRGTGEKLGDAEKAMRACTELEAEIAELHAAYDQYFLGLERRPPAEKHKAVKKLMGELRGAFVNSTPVKFRISNLQQRLNTFERLWERTLLEIENGTYKRDVFKARKKVEARKKKASPAAVESDGLDDLQIDEDLDLSDLDGGDLESAMNEAAAAVERPSPPPTVPTLPAVPSVRPLVAPGTTGLVPAVRPVAAPTSAGTVTVPGVPPVARVAPEVSGAVAASAGAAKTTSLPPVSPGTPRGLPTVTPAGGPLASRSPTSGPLPAVAPATPRGLPAVAPVTPAGGPLASRSPTSGPLPTVSPATPRGLSTVAVTPAVGPVASKTPTSGPLPAVSAATPRGLPTVTPVTPTGGPGASRSPTSGPLPAVSGAPAAGPQAKAVSGPLPAVKVTSAPPGAVVRALTPGQRTPSGPLPEARPSRPPAPVGSDGGLNDGKIKAIYDAFVMAKKRCGEDTSKLSLDSVATTLRSQVPSLMKQHNAKSVEFKVVIKDGKAVLRALPKE